MQEDTRQWLRAEFERCRPWIQAALDRDIGTHTIDDVWNDIEDEKAYLLPLPNSVIVSVIEQYPQLKMLRFWLVGGDLDELLAHENVVIDWAKEQGCTVASWIGRRGWLRKLPHYTDTYSVGIRRI